MRRGFPRRVWGWKSGSSVLEARKAEAAGSHLRSPEGKCPAGKCPASRGVPVLQEPQALLPTPPHPEPEAASQQLNSHGSLRVGCWEQGLRVPARSEQPASLPLTSRQQKLGVAAHGGPTHRACTRGPCPPQAGDPGPPRGSHGC